MQARRVKDTPAGRAQYREGERRQILDRSMTTFRFRPDFEMDLRSFSTLLENIIGAGGAVRAPRQSHERTTDTLSFSPHRCCHPEQSEGPAFAFAFAFLSVIPVRESASTALPYPQPPADSCPAPRSEPAAISPAIPPATPPRSANLALLQAQAESFR